MFSRLRVRWCTLFWKRKHLFRRKLRSNSFTPMPSGVGVNEVLCATYRRYVFSFQESAYSFSKSAFSLSNVNVTLLIHKLSDATLVSGYGIGSSGDRSADNDVVRTDKLSLLGSHNALLVADVTVSKTNTGGYGNEAASADIMNLTSLKR